MDFCADLLRRPRCSNQKYYTYLHGLLEYFLRTVTPIPVSATNKKEMSKLNQQAIMPVKGSYSFNFISLTKIL